MKKFEKKFEFFKMILITLVLLPVHSFASPIMNTSTAWSSWLTYDSNSHIAVYEMPWQRFLDLYVFTNAQGINMIKYSQVAPADGYTVTAYLAELSQIPVNNLSRPQQLAFWINLYNALIVSTVMKNFPVTSMSDINLASSWYPGPWVAKLIQIDNIPVSLSDIENRILLPIWKDPRIHYLLNCGAIGCPNLPRQALTPANVNTLLNMAAHNFVNSGYAVKIENGKLAVSNIYLWHREDFGGSDQAIIDHLIQYANPFLREKLMNFHKIDHGFFDWSLNGI